MKQSTFEAVAPDLRALEFSIDAHCADQPPQPDWSGIVCRLDALAGDEPYELLVSRSLVLQTGQHVYGIGNRGGRMRVDWTAGAPSPNSIVTCDTETKRVLHPSARQVQRLAALAAGATLRTGVTDGVPPSLFEIWFDGSIGRIVDRWKDMPYSPPGSHPL